MQSNEFYFSLDVEKSERALCRGVTLRDMKRGEVDLKKKKISGCMLTGNAKSLGNH